MNSCKTYSQKGIMNMKAFIVSFLIAIIIGVTGITYAKVSKDNDAWKLVSVVMMLLEDNSTAPSDSVQIKLSGYRDADAQSVDLGALLDGQVLDLRDIGVDELDLEIIPPFETDNLIQSVSLSLSGPEIVSNIDNTQPYTLFNENNRFDLSEEDLAPGEYSLTVVGYSDLNAAGSTQFTEIIRFSVIDTTPDSSLPNIDSLTLVELDSNTHREVQNGDDLDLSDISSRLINFQANPLDERLVESVHFALTGPIELDRAENFAPYSLIAENINFDLSNNGLPVGRYQLVITPYSQDNLEGIQGPSYSISFSVSKSDSPPPVVPQIDGVELLGESGSVIQRIVEGTSIDLRPLSDNTLSFKALPTANSGTLSIAFELDGPSNHNETLNSPEFSSASIDIGPGGLVPGSYNLSLIPYSELDAQGQSGTTVSISFSVTRSDDNSPSPEAWSNPSTWGGTLPAEGDDVTIESGREIFLDITPPKLGSLSISGKLNFANKTLNLTAENILVHSSGEFNIGSMSEPFAHKATITITGGIGSNPEARGIMVHNGGVITMIGQPPEAWVKLNRNAAKNSSTLTLNSTVDWSVGDKVIVTPTDFYNRAKTELHHLASVSGTQIGLSSGLQASRWGVLQYVSDSGMSLDSSDQISDASSAPKVLDERAEVANLTRNIVIQGANDDLWQTQGFGVHMMVMGANSNITLDGVEFNRAGQAGRLGRYPIHFHRINYPDGVNYLPSVGTKIIRNSSIWNSSNRCITIHATNDVTFDNNICYDIKGHAVFLEDAVERDNVITNNLVANVATPIRENALIGSDKTSGFGGSSCYWITNPDNTIMGNVAADCAFIGFWMAFPERALNVSSAVNTTPIHIPLKRFENNVAHSVGESGFHWDHPPVNADGGVSPRLYEPFVGEKKESNATLALSHISGNLSYKNRACVWNRLRGARFSSAVNADCIGKTFAGGSYDSRIQNTLIVAQSLNNGTSWRDIDNQSPPTAIASYHSQFVITDNTVVGFQAHPAPLFRTNIGGTQHTLGCMLGTDDYYIRALEVGTYNISNNRLIDSCFAQRTQVPNGNSHYTLAGALWDPHGSLGPEDQYWVYDQPFFTHGQNCTQVDASGTNGVSCPGPFYGVENYFGHDIRISGRNTRGLNVTRYDDNQNEVGTWSVKDGLTGDGFFTIMRHFAAKNGGRYSIDFFDDVNGSEVSFYPTRDLVFSLTNFYRDTDSVLIGLNFSGQDQARMYVNAFYNHDNACCGANVNTMIHDAVILNSFSEVENAAQTSIYQDKDNNRVWLKIFSPSHAFKPPIDYLNARVDDLSYDSHIRVFTCEGAVADGASGRDLRLRQCN